jgi:hypothetical protein
MPHVFISYRRSDSAPEAGRLADSLRHLLGAQAVFRDIVAITAGSNFDSALDEALKQARIVIVLIGPQWLAELHKRQALPERDFVRLEVAHALQAERRVIPVLLRGAELPSTEALPPDLQSLTRKQAIVLRDDLWDAGIERIVQAIGKPYKWGALALRAVGMLAAVTVAVLGTMGNANILVARDVILAVMATYAVVEVIAARRGKGR